MYLDAKGDITPAVLERMLKAIADFDKAHPVPLPGRQNQLAPANPVPLPGRQHQPALAAPTPTQQAHPNPPTTALKPKKAAVQTPASAKPSSTVAGASAQSGTAAGTSKAAGKAKRVQPLASTDAGSTAQAAKPTASKAKVPKVPTGNPAASEPTTTHLPAPKPVKSKAPGPKPSTSALTVQPATTHAATGPPVVKASAMPRPKPKQPEAGPSGHKTRAPTDEMARLSVGTLAKVPPQLRVLDEMDVDEAPAMPVPPLRKRAHETDDEGSYVPDKDRGGSESDQLKDDDEAEKKRAKGKGKEKAQDAERLAKHQKKEDRALPPHIVDAEEREEVNGIWVPACIRCQVMGTVCYVRARSVACMRCHDIKMGCQKTRKEWEQARDEGKVVPMGTGPSKKAKQVKSAAHIVDSDADDERPPAAKPKKQRRNPAATFIKATSNGAATVGGPVGHTPALPSGTAGGSAANAPPVTNAPAPPSKASKGKGKGEIPLFVAGTHR